jgi:tetratricopeptide (TPR) repeat protein
MDTEPRVSSLVLRWQERRQQGQFLSVAELCADCPELREAVDRQLQVMASMEGFLGLNDVATGDRPANLTTPFEEVIALCEGFTADYGAGAEPSIRSYLERVGDDAQPTLLRNLLALEIERRRAAGEQPRLGDYLERYPQFAAVVRAVFLERSSVASLATQEPPGTEAAARAPAAARLGEYRLLGELGRGAMGVVYEALHLQRGDRVALKTLPRVDAAALHRFKREFRAVADINHPNLLGLHTLQADGGQWFFTMDLVRGVPFLQYVRPGGAPDESRLRSALAQLVAGVMALHGHHIVHRDLKPSNVLVTADGHVVILDFGVVLELDPTSRSAERTECVAGTVLYMAPEQADGTATAASDWYAVGVMLHEALTGRPPFLGSALQVLQNKRRLDPPRLPEGTQPEDLARLCQRLLARDPQQRPDALAIVKAQGAGAAPAGAAAVRCERQLVGRDQHLAALRDAYRAAQERREPLTVFLSGRSGEGKSTLAEEFLTPLRAAGRSAVMSGRSYDRESVPFKALDMVVDSLAGYLRSRPEEEAARLLPDDIAALVQVFPVLERVEVIARAAGSRRDGLEEQQVRERAFLALRSLLTRVGRDAPVVWFIDDLQWGDADSAEALFTVLRPPEAPAILLLGAYRSDEAEGSAFLRMWKELQCRHNVTFADREIKLAPLSEAESIELVVELLAEDTEVIRRRAAEFARETRGNPFLLVELVGCFDPDTDSFQPMPLHEVLTQKLGRLPAGAQALLEVVAVSGQALALDEASRTAGHAQLPMSTLIHMRTERLVRLIGTDESPLVDTYHDRVRETVLGQLDQGRRRALHRTLGEVIEKTVGGLSDAQVVALEGGEGGKAVPRSHDLAYHFNAAGERQKAWVYALLAAEQARRQLALGVAVDQYAVARRNAAGTPDALRHRLAAGRGEALMLLGHYDEATAEFNTAAGLTRDPVALATVEGYQGEIALKRGWAGRSAALCETALRRLGNWVPRSVLGWVWGLLREPFVHGLHRLFPRRLHGKAPTAQSDLTSRLLVRFGYANFMLNSPKSLWAVYAGMNQGERFPPSPSLAFNYAGYGAILAMSGRFARGMNYIDRSLSLRRDANDFWGIAQSLNAQGLALYARARFEESIAKLDESLDLYRKTGDQWEMNANRLIWGLCHIKLGNLSAPIDATQMYFADGVRLGDDNSCHFGLSFWSIAARGNLPFGELSGLFRSLPDNISATSMLLMGQGHWHTFHGRTDKALEAFEGAYQLAKRNLALNFFTVPTLPCLVTALRRHADTLEAADGRQAQRLRRRAFRLAKWVARLTRFFPPHYPHALRELGYAYSARGRLRKALRLAEQSCAVAEAQKARCEYAESLLLRGRLAQQLGLPAGQEQVRTAEAALAEFDRMIQAATRQPAAR